MAGVLGVLIQTGNLDTDRRQWEETQGKDGLRANVLQGSPRPGTGPLLIAFRRNQSRQYLDFGLLASSMVKQFQSVVLHYSSLTKLVHPFSLGTL